MASTGNKPFHTYENAGYEDQVHDGDRYVAPNMAPTNTITTSIAADNCGNVSGIAINKTAIESPFPDPMHDPSANIKTNKIFSATDSTGTTRMLTSSRATSGNNLVTKLISLPSQSHMDSLKDWSISTFKCTKQLINEKRGICSITNDAQLQADIDRLRENREKLLNMLRTMQQMNNHYSQLVKTQQQLHSLMNEMSVKCFANSPMVGDIPGKHPPGGKQIIANFSSLSNNLSSTATSTGPSSHKTSVHSPDGLSEFLPVLNHMRNSSVDLSEDLKKNSIMLSSTIKNGEKLVAALTFFCSNLSTLIYKTIEDTLESLRQFESARLEYDAERNSLNFASPNAQTSITFSSDKLELARVRYEQLKEDVQIKMKFLEENTIKVLHKQLLLFNSAFASYASGNTAALEASLKQFSIR